MNDDNRDNALAALFRQMRAFDEAQAPAFRLPEPAAAVASTGAARRRVGGTLLAAAAALSALFLWSRGRRPAAPSIVAWEAPTSFLLDTPGHELLEKTSYDAVSPVTEESDRKRSQK